MFAKISIAVLSTLAIAGGSFTAPQTQQPAAQCAGGIPWTEGNPWRGIQADTSDLAMTLWLVDSDPNLELLNVTSGSPGCYLVIFKGPE